MSENASRPQRIFKTGSSIITESPAMVGLSVEDVRDLLKHTYPELAHATVRETPQSDGTLLIEWLPIAGKKG